MMRKLMILTLALLLAGCAAPAAKTAAQPTDETFAALYKSMEGSLPAMMELPPEMVLDYYGIEDADRSAGLFYISSDNMLADEVVMLQAVDAAAADRLETLLKARLDAKASEARDYSPEQYDIIMKCPLIREGNTLALIVCADYDAMAKLFKEGIA